MFHKRGHRQTQRREQRQKRAELFAEAKQRLEAELEYTRNSSYEEACERLKTEKANLLDEYGRLPHSRKVKVRTWERVRDTTPMLAIYNERFAEILEEVKNEKNTAQSTN
jgi:hypothetical protein